MRRRRVSRSRDAGLARRAAGQPGSRTKLQALPYDRYVPQTRPTDWDTERDLLSLQYTETRPIAWVAVPAVLRPIPALNPATATATRVVLLSQGLINGKTMDMNRVDVSARLGATEIWQIENVVGMDHPFHLHGFQFQVLDRDGVAEPVSNRVADSEGPPDFWASQYTVAKIGPYPPAPFPTANEKLPQ